MTLSLDGSITGTFSTTNTHTVTLTTSNTNDVICVYVATGALAAASGPATVTSVTATGLTFTQRSAQSNKYTGAPNSWNNLELWTAVAASALSSVVITVTCTTSPAVDDACIIAFGVSGALSTSSPWDSNANFPNKYSDPAHDVPVSNVTVNTSQAHDFIISAGATTDGTGIATGGAIPVWTQIARVDNTGGSNFCHLTAAYIIVSTIQSGIVVINNGGTFTALSGGTVGLADAITSDAVITGSLFLTNRGIQNAGMDIGSGSIRG